MVIRFFSFFTILPLHCNPIFHGIFLKPKTVPFKWLLSNGTSTALTAFILIVGLLSASVEENMESNWPAIHRR
jgi:hypothetical protein